MGWWWYSGWVPLIFPMWVGRLLTNSGSWLGVGRGISLTFPMWVGRLLKNSGSWGSSRDGRVAVSPCGRSDSRYRPRTVHRHTQRPGMNQKLRQQIPQHTASQHTQRPGMNQKLRQQIPPTYCKPVYTSTWHESETTTTNTPYILQANTHNDPA